MAVLNKTTLAELVQGADKQITIVLKEGIPVSNILWSYISLRLIYQELTNLMLRQNKPLLDIRVLISPSFCNLPNTIKSHSYQSLDMSEAKGTISNLPNYPVGRFDLVAIGGTFDRLHAGHKLMLSVAVMLAKRKVLCGITDDSMLKDKELREKIETWNDRASRLQEFVEEFAPQGVSLEIIKLMDNYGPTTTVKELEALVVSPETLPGGMASK